MGSEWQEYMVRELQEIAQLLVEDGNHGEYRPRRDEFCKEGTAFIRASDMDRGRVLFNSASKINATAVARIRKGIGVGGDVLLSHKGTVGKLAMVPLDAPPFVCSPQTTFWRSLNPDAIDRRYLYAYMHSPHFRQQLDSRKGETDMADYVSLTAQREFRVLLPPIADQRAIGHILGSLDDKIELNRRMNETLEAMAQAIFKSWFVDFDPVKGWGVGEISDIADVTSGKRPHKRAKKRADEFIIPLYGGGGVMAYVTEPMLSTPFVLTGRVGTLGKVFRITESCWPSDNTLLFLPIDESYLEFLYFLLQRIDFDSLNRGSTQPLVTQTDLKNQKMVRPHDKTISVYYRHINPLFMKIDDNKEESRTLASLRDTLLPKLLSGELCVPYVEKFMEGISV